MIRVKDLTKRYGRVPAVDNISFEVDQGGVVGFLGPNGAGKTTTIRVLACYQPASSGSASVAGFDVFSQSMEVRRRVGYLPESTPLYPEMRVREFLHFRGKLRGLTGAHRIKAIDRVVDRCWLAEFVDRPIGHLSKGMKQRVGLADAIMHDPPVLILDEPTIGLDPTQIRETRNLIRELGEHHTVLLCSHVLHEVEQVCSRAIIIAAGRIVASGSPQELRDRFRAQGQVVAEVRGQKDEVTQAVTSVSGVEHVEATTVDGWTQLAIQASSDQDVREPVVKLVADKGWSLREIRRVGASLEDFFVQITAEQQERRG